MAGFPDACKKSIDYQAPHKRKYTWANQAPFLTKEINKEIMTSQDWEINFFILDLMEIKEHIMRNVIVV